MGRFLESLNIKVGEGSRLLAAMLLNLLVMFSIYLARAARDALFYAEIGPSYLPWMFVATAVFALFSNELFSRAANRLLQQDLFRWMLIISGVVFLFIFLTLKFDLKGNIFGLFPTEEFFPYVMIFIGTELVAVLLVVTAAAFVNDAALFDLGAIKRLSPYYVAAGHVGGLLSGVLAVFYADVIGVPQFYLISVVTICASLLLSVWIVKNLYRYRLDFGGSDGADDAGFIADARLVFTNRYLLLFVLITVCNFFLGSSFEWVLSESATRHTEGNVAELAKFLGWVNIGGGIIAVFFQIFFIGGIISRYGVANANLGAPLFLLLGAIVIALSPNIVWFAVIARGAFFVAEAAFNQTLIRFIYNVVRERDRLRAQGFIESNIITLSIAATGIVLLAIDPNGISITIFTIALVSVALLMLVISWRLKTHYTAQARSNYLSLSSLGQQELFEDVFQSKDETSSEIVDFIAMSEDPDTQLQAINVVARGRIDQYYSKMVLERLGDEWPRQVRVAALKAMAVFDKEDDAKRILPLLTDPDPAIVVAALDTSSGLTGAAVKVQDLEPYLAGNDPEVASSALVQLMQNGGVEGMKAGIETLERFRESKSIEQRIALITTFGKLGQSTIDDLINLKENANETETNAIISALGTIPNRRVYEHILSSMSNPIYTLVARSALLRQPAFFADLILETYSNSDLTTSTIRQNLAWVLARMQPTKISENEPIRYNHLIAKALWDGIDDSSRAVQLSSASAIAYAVSHQHITSLNASDVGAKIDLLINPIAVNAACLKYIMRRSIASTDDYTLAIRALKDIDAGYQEMVFNLLQAAYPDENLTEIAVTLTVADLREEAIELLENVFPRKIFRAFEIAILKERSDELFETLADPINNFEKVWQHLESFNDESLLFAIYHTWNKTAVGNQAYQRVMHSSAAQDIATRYKEENMDSVLDRAQHLAETKLFSRIQIGDLIEVARGTATEIYGENDRIYEIDTPSEALFLVVSGSVGLYRTDNSDNLQKVESIEKHETFGDTSVISGAGYSEVARAEEPTTCLLIKRSDVKELFSMHPAMYEDLTDMVQRRLARMYDAVISQIGVGEQIKGMVRDLIEPNLLNLQKIPEIEQLLKKNAEKPVNVYIDTERGKQKKS